MGVNLPAHLVIIKSTMFYNLGMYQEYPDTQVLQMIGRAGRPQFDTSATAVIMTKNQTKVGFFWHVRRRSREQSDQGLHCLLFCLHLLDSLLYGRVTLFKF